MPKNKISEYSLTAASNTDIGGIDIAEGCAPSGINNAIRELMSDLKDFQGGTSGDALAIAGGGTGATTAINARIALLPSIAGNGSKVLAVNSGATDFEYIAAATGDVTTNTVQTITGTKTFSGTSSTLAMILNDTAEVVTVSATAATGTINYDITTQAVLYYTTNASGNFTVNFRASSGTSLNTVMSIGQSVTAAFLVTNGSVAYYNNVVQVDGATVTPKYQGTAPAAGNASSVDVYMYTIVKTASATFTVFASQTKFA